MAKTASKTVIGAFVVGAVALGVAAVLVFGSGKFLSDRPKYVMFFDGSLKGLQVGAPVVMNGVKVGEVTDISVVGDPATLRFLSPVYIEIDPEKIRVLGNEKQKLSGILTKKKYPWYDQLLAKGLKGQLVMQSFVTGQLWIGLGLHPDKPIRLVGAAPKDIPEIPTIPTTMEELQKTVENLPIKEIAAKLDNVITGIDRIVNSKELRQTVVNLERATASIDRLVTRVDSQVEPLSADIHQTLVSAQGALAQAEKTLAFKEGVPGQVATNLVETLTSARGALDESRKALVEVQDLTAQSAYLGYVTGTTLEEVNSLSRSMRSLTDYLERHPESLIRGKSPDKGETR